MNVRRLGARAISETFSMLRFLRAPTVGLRVLMYHAIGTPARGDRLGLYSLSSAVFESQMEMLAAQFGKSVVEFGSHEVKPDQLNLAITFDDGYMDNLEVAAPLLVARGLPFTVFVTSEFVRQAVPGFLTPKALRELAAVPGARIGAHGANHVALADCDDRTLREELISSREFLEDTIGAEVTTMAYPYGSTNRRVRDAAENAGYTAAGCSLGGVNAMDSDPFLLARTEIIAFDDRRAFQQKIRGDWDWYRWRTQDRAC